MAKRPKLGQHFLHDASVLSRIARALPLGSGTPVVEIGPGEGALTAHLLESGARVTAVELDRGLAARLREQYAGEERFALVESDVLEADLDALLSAEEPGYVFGNLPYYITSPIIRRILPMSDRVRAAAFLIQKEVAERVTARKGSRDYGFLSAICRLWAEPEYLFTVKPGSFRPPPRVDSAVIRLTLRTGAVVEDGLVAFLEAAFRQPRKTLLNNLTALYERERVAAFPEAKLRAQQMDVEELAGFWKTLEGR